MQYNKHLSSDINLQEWDRIIINNSAGKDSICVMWAVYQIAKAQGFPMEKIHVSHQDLGESEWEGVFDLAKEQAELFGWDFHHIKRNDKDGKEETLLEYVERRKMWPGNKNRFCTSDFKRGPGAKILTKLSPSKNRERVLYVFGFRAQESPARKKKVVLSRNNKLSGKKRDVYEWNPIHSWTVDTVWEVIRENNLPYH